MDHQKSGFNSPSLGPGNSVTGLSRPPRLAKLRKPLAGHRPSLFRFISQHEDGQGLTGSGSESSRVDPSQQNAGAGSVLLSDDKIPKTSKNNSFSQKVGFRDAERSKLVDDMRELRVSNTWNFNAGSTDSTSAIGCMNSSGRDHSLSGVDEMKVSELQGEMRGLFIEKELLRKLRGENVAGELQNRMKQLDIEGSAKIGSMNSYLGGKNESFSGIFDSRLPNEMKNLGIRDPSHYSQNERFDGRSWDKDGSVDSNGENHDDLNSLNITTCLKNTFDPCKTKFNPVTKPNHGMQNEDWSDGMSSSGTMSSVFTFKGGIHYMNNNMSIADRNSLTSLPLFPSGGTSFEPVGNIYAMQSVDRDEKKVEFSFTSKLDSITTQHMEFKTPDTKGPLVFGLNNNGETRLKKKKGKSKKPPQVTLKYGKDFVLQEILQEAVIEPS